MTEKPRSIQRKYLLFVGEEKEYTKGLDDFIDSFDTLEEAMIAAEIDCCAGWRAWYIIYDRDTLACVGSGGKEPRSPIFHETHRSQTK